MFVHSMRTDIVDFNETKFLIAHRLALLATTRAGVLMDEKEEEQLSFSPDWREH